MAVLPWHLNLEEEDSRCHEHGSSPTMHVVIAERLGDVVVRAPPSREVGEEVESVSLDSPSPRVRCEGPPISGVERKCILSFAF